MFLRFNGTVGWVSVSAAFWSNFNWKVLLKVVTLIANESLEKEFQKHGNKTFYILGFTYSIRSLKFSNLQGNLSY